MEFTAKSKKEAIELGLKELNITEEQAIITVIEEGEKGLFGKIKKMAKVDISLNMSDGDKAVKFLEGLFTKLGVVAKAKLVSEGEQIVIDLIAEDSATLIGYRGEILDSLQTLAGAFLNIGKKDYQKVVVDCENYRDRREETLVKLAHKLEEKSADMRREVILEPMSPFERRIIHTALSNSDKVSTKSEGKEPNRYVVIVPNDKDEFAKPYNAGRNNDHKGGKGGRREDKSKDRRPRGKGGFGGKKNNSPAPQKKKTITFGTYLGNSLKDN